MLEIKPLPTFSATILVPGSKSFTNRALLLASLASGNSTIRYPVFCQDTLLMLEALKALGFSLEVSESDCQVTVSGEAGKIPDREADLSVGNAGTVARFITALTCLGRGVFRISGSDRMQRRPMDELLRALRALGADISCSSQEGFLPVTVKGQGLLGGEARVSGEQSSQFLSALLMVAPYARHDITILAEGELSSRPFVDMTLETMRKFGVIPRREDYRRFTIPAGQGYQATDFVVESDATNASYFFAAAALTGSRLRVENLSSRSCQGDVAFVSVLEQMGARVERGTDWIEVQGAPLHGVTVDMRDYPDVVPTLAVVAACARGTTEIRQVEHLRHKETDRLSALAAELAKVGVVVREGKGELSITGGAGRPAIINTYNDHRMAMSFSLLGLTFPGIRILNERCVEKSFPDFYEKLAELYPPAERPVY